MPFLRLHTSYRWAWPSEGLVFIIHIGHCCVLRHVCLYVWVFVSHKLPQRLFTPISVNSGQDFPVGSSSLLFITQCLPIFLFKTPQKVPTSSDGSFIPPLNTINIPGMTVTSNLSWKPQSRQTATYASKKLEVLFISQRFL